MAASLNLSQSPISGKPLIVKNGVLTLHGFGVRVRMQSGHLEIEDGVGMERRKIKLARVGHKLKRLVCISEDGFATLSALKWLSDVGASFVMLNRNGTVLLATGPTTTSDARLRRAQALALGNGVGLEISRALIDAKLRGQEQLVRERLSNSASANLIASFRERLSAADTFELIRRIEARAALCYFAAWRNTPVLWPKSDLPRIPDHWRTAGSRQSPLSGGPRLAVTPVHAILNYCFAFLEAETRIAVSALGLDPCLGLGLHTDTPNRDSLVFDVLEPVRPQIESWVLSWIEREPLRRMDFFETPNGNCRLRSHLCAKLSETALTWAKLVAPWAEWVAQALWSSIRKRIRDDLTLPTRLTQRRRSEGRGNEFKVGIAPPPYPRKVCLGCGATTHGGRHCAACGREVSRGELIESAKVGRVVAQGPKSQEKRSETQRQHRAAQQAWRSSPKPAWLNEDAYLEKIYPRLGGITISVLASTLGVSGPYAADIRAGRRRPHPRHWQTLAELVGVSQHKRTDHTG
jgi:CRISPR-associated endonuclease Cas1